MTPIVRHPLVRRDLREMVRHVGEISGNRNAALRRLAEVEGLLSEIAASPTSGSRLSGALSGWLVRHGGRGRMLTIVFRFDEAESRVFVALVAFGGQDWLGRADARKDIAPAPLTVDGFWP